MSERPNSRSHKIKLQKVRIECEKAVYALKALWLKGIIPRPEGLKEIPKNKKIETFRFIYKELLQKAEF